MKIGMVGLGRMGSNMAHRLIKQGHQCVVFDLNPANTAKAAADFGAIPASSFENMIALLDPPRAHTLEARSRLRVDRAARHEDHPGRLLGGQRRA